MDVFAITFAMHPIGIGRQSFTRRLPIPGIAPKILIPAQSSPDWISFCWANSSGNRSWMNRFLAYIRGAKVRFDFFSFEFYPFDNICADAAPHLMEIPERLGAMMRSLRRDGVPADIPWLMTEYGYSVFAGRPEVDIEGALFNADTIGVFLTLGGAKPYLYGYEPNYLQDELKCSWGNLMMLQLTSKSDQLNRLPS